MLWHLLSLDAPTVAVLWMWFLAAANGVRLRWTSILAMGTAVWLLYAADRLLDCRGQANLELRHHFHHRHRGRFLTGMVAAACGLVTMLPQIPRAALQLYLIEGSFVTAYFVLIHMPGSAKRLPKEHAVGVFFAAATFIPTVSAVPALRRSLVIPALLFAGLCILNCLFIDGWEHPGITRARRLVPPLPQLAIALLVCSGAVCVLGNGAPRQIAAAVALSTLMLLGLHLGRHRLSPPNLRAAADLALLTPLLLVPFLP